MGVIFDVIPSNFDEHLDDARLPEAVAEELGLGKAQDVAQRYPEAIVIGSDSIVALGNRQLAKPENDSEAREMLQAETLAPNKVIASVAVVCLAEHMQEVAHEIAWVYFKPYDSAAVEAYLATGDWRDKAGGYGIQSGAAPLVDHIRGNIDTIMGLPTHVLAPMLEKLGIDAHPVDVHLPVKVVPR